MSPEPPDRAALLAQARALIEQMSDPRNMPVESDHESGTIRCAACHCRWVGMSSEFPLPHCEDCAWYHAPELLIALVEAVEGLQEEREQRKKSGLANQLLLALADKAIAEADNARLLAALEPFAALVHDDGVDAPYPEERWRPLLVAAKKALQGQPSTQGGSDATRRGTIHE